MNRKFTLVRILIVFSFLLMVSVVAQAQQSTRQIIVFQDGVRLTGNQTSQFASAYGLEISRSYNSVLNGVAAVVPAGRLRALQNDPRVAYVEEDLLMSINVQEIPTGIDRSYASGLDRVGDGGDERVDVDVAVIDTGVDFEHPDLNVVGGTDCTLTSGRGRFATRYCGAPNEGTGGDDDHYHGTHVGGTIGALDNGIGVVGVAPGARLWAVKVLGSDGSGYTSGIIAGIDWVVQQGDIEVANMSLGGEGTSTAYLEAIDNAVANGVVMVVAAGNSALDANGYSPAFVPSAITVSALADFDGVPGAVGSPTCRADEDDTLANFSNFGSAVDIAAPGVCILSTYPLEQGEYASISGTSMAAPHVAGAAALLASGNNSPQNAADVEAIRDTLVNTGNFNWVDDSGDGILEPLLDLSNTNLYNPSYVGGNNGGGNNAPVADIISTCMNLFCSFDATGSSDDGSIVNYAWDFGDGATAGGVTTSRGYATDGTYTVTLTVTDNEGATDTATETVTVSGATGGNATSVSVSDLDGSANNAGRNWFATVTITVSDDLGGNVVGATVTGTFSTGDSVSCTTGGNGSCSVSSSQVRKSGSSSISFSVSSVSANLPYDSADNSDADGSSNGTSITVVR